jgi:hypothetical protein
MLTVIGICEAELWFAIKKAQFAESFFPDG